MKIKIKRIVAGLLVAVMLFGSAPLETLTGFNFGSLFEVKAEAAESQWFWPVPDVKTLTKDRYYKEGHKGIDIPGSGKQVVASKSGTVKYVFTGCNNWSHNEGKTCLALGKCSPQSNGKANDNYGFGMCNYGFGRGVVIDHGDGTYSQYAHMSTIQVKPNQKVKQGDLLGTTGAYGNAYGAHLHFVLLNGSALNNSSKFNNTPKNIGNYPNAKINYIFSSNPVSYKAGTYKTNADKVRFRSSPGLSNNEIYYEMPTGTELVVTEVSSKDAYNWGKAVYKEKTGWFALEFADYIGETIQKPQAPKLSADKSGNLAVGTKVSFSWDTVDHSNGYKVYVNGEEKYSGNNATYILDLNSPIDYSVYVVAYNSKYTSEKSQTIDITAHNDSTVSFEDWDGTVLEIKNVAYGENAISPDVPSREGYTFIGWDKSLNRITDDTVITATYRINKYTVKFLDDDEKVLSTQTVEYGSDAIPPEITDLPTGYEFFGWDSTDYLAVKGDASIKGIYAWSNEELPVVVQITSAKRLEDGYYVYFDLTNYPKAITRGRAVVSLKTSEGKLVETTESAAFSIPAGGTKSQMEVFVPCEEAASVVEIVVVNSYSTGVPISASATATVENGLSWSAWSDTAPAEGSYSEMETRTVYRYRDKMFTTATTPTKDGWTNYDSSWEWSPYGSWSSWSRTAQTKSDTRDVETKTVTDSAAYTKYNLYYYRYWNTTYNKYYYTYGSGMGGTKYTRTVKSTEVKFYKDYENGKYKGYVKNSGYYNFNGEVWFLSSTENVPAKTHTEYRYRDRSKIYTYYFYKWLDWSEWSTEPVTPTDNREVDTPKTQYRYRNEFEDAGVEDSNGILRKASTNPEGLTENDILLPVLANCAGKEITLFIYKIDEASDWTNEFVGQSVINDDGSYSFSFKLREEPSIKTGDFTVAIGVEGTSNTMIIGKIEAPRAQHTVVFRNWDGSIIDTQIVDDGKSASIPEVNPSREGYDFVGWNSSTSNVQSDLDIEARFIKKVYTVVFVDWTTETITSKQFEHGEILLPPDVEKTEGYNFLGWSGVTDGETIVTENMIVTAEYDAETYEVKIYDFNMNIIGTQMVEHGSYVDLPNEIEKSKYVFLGWKDAGDNNINNVTENLEVYPMFVFEDTVENPVASIKTGTYTANQLVELRCGTEGAVIFYTTDGTDPLTSETAKPYQTPIEITRSMELKFVASAFEMNDSSVVSELYAINTGATTSEWMAYEELPDYVLANPLDYSLSSEVGYKYKDVVVTSSTSEIERLENDGWTNEGFKYGIQSEWTLEYPELSDTEYEVVEQKPPQVEETHYKYTHFKYYDSAAAKYTYSPTVIDGVEGVTEEYVSPTRLSVAGFISGTSTPYYTYNNESWYNQEAVTVLVDPGYMMYAYKLKNYTLTKWTEWTTEAPSDGETRETESDTVYCFTPPEMCIVTIINGFDETEKIVKLGVVGHTIRGIDFEDLSAIGYTVEGLFRDYDFTTMWSLENDVLVGDVTLYVKQAKNTYTINFIDADGTILETQIVEYGCSALPPEVKTPDGYVFVGWDNESYLDVECDMDITAIVKHESEIVKVKLNRSKFTTTAGSAFYMHATVAPEGIADKSVVWTSSNYSVVDINSEGIALAISSGTATITATAFDGTSASCVITVLGNPDNELTPTSSSSLVVDSSGYLRNIPIITDEKTGTHTADTVENIKSQFVNDNIVIADINGKTLSDEDRVGTGSVVMLMDGETVIDSIIIIVTGDFNGDGLINNRDAAMITRYLVDKEEALIYQMIAIDVNGDGYVNNRDASMVSRYLVGKEEI